MSSITSELSSTPPTRLRSFVWPREHGAWGILLVPLVTGASVATPDARGFLSLTLLTLAALALFCLRTPVEVQLEASPLRAQTSLERRAVRFSIVGYGTVAAACLGALFMEGYASGLLALGALAGLFFVVQASLKTFGRSTRMIAQWVGALGLTSTGAGAYYVVTGQLDLKAFVVWAANWLFAVNQIHYVQVRIQSARAFQPPEKIRQARYFLIIELLSAILLVAAVFYGALPALASLAFVPVLIRGMAWAVRKSEPLRIHRLGLTELAHAAAFGVLFTLGFHFHAWRP